MNDTHNVAKNAEQQKQPPTKMHLGTVSVLFAKANPKHVHTPQRREKAT